ncbi:MAG: ammonium transporter [Kofleriaceae bacterium]
MKCSLWPVTISAVLFALCAVTYADSTESPATEAVSRDLGLSINSLWVLIAAALVFFMQTGFLAFEVGSVRPKNAVVTAMKNLGDWMVISLFFYVVGFGIMFGHSSNGYFGSDMFFGSYLAPDAHELGWTFVVFQLAFCGTAATIVSGAMSERTGFAAYLGFCVAIGAFIYPIYGHWVWGNGYIEGNKPFLASKGFIDFAGSSVVHLVGGTASLVGVTMVGPRLGLYSADGKRTPMGGNLVWSGLGTLILWFGWWGFNGGSTLALNADVGAIIFNTNLAGASAGLMAFIHCVYAHKGDAVVAKSLGGTLGGLVAITANCNIVSPAGAVAIGLTAGIIHNITYNLVLYRWRLDDVVGAVPVHGFCGAWGVLCVALFGKAELLGRSRFEQLGVQALGIVVCVGWVATTSYIVWRVLRATVGIRVSPMREIHGLELKSDDMKKAA